MAKKKRSSPSGAGKVPPPRCKAILLCDQTILEAGTRKISIIGIFSHFSLPDFPGTTRPFTVFMHLTDGIGRYEVVVEIHDLKEDIVLARAAELGIKFSQRLSRVNLVIPVPPLVLAHPGRYDLVVFANGEEIDRQQFTATAPEGFEDEPDDAA